MAFTDEQNEQIRKDLIRAARRCGITIGMRKTSVGQLTEAVGISKGSFYKFFESKELLFFAVLEDIHTECFAAAQKSLQENATLLPADRAAAAILAACRWLSKTKAFVFIENDADFLLHRLPEEVKTAHYHDDETHIRLLLEKYGLVPKRGISLAAQGRYGAGRRHSAGLDFNRLPSGADWGALPAGAGNAGAGCLPGAICISGKAAVMRLFKRDIVSIF